MHQRIHPLVEPGVPALDLREVAERNLCLLGVGKRHRDREIRHRQR